MKIFGTVDDCDERLAYETERRDVEEKILHVAAGARMRVGRADAHVLLRVHAVEHRLESFDHFELDDLSAHAYVGVHEDRALFVRRIGDDEGATELAKVNARRVLADHGVAHLRREIARFVHASRFLSAFTMFTSAAGPVMS